MICQACGEANRPGRRFCRRCGGALAVSCATCGAANEAGDEFCGECGVALNAAVGATAALSAHSTPTPERGSRVSERRHVSVLFADLVGFTALSEQRDAEDVRELLSEYFSTARTVITRYGGTVEKFIGDAVMALWGVPAAQEDDAERAVRAALELVDAVAAFGESVNAPQLQARAAVLSGEAAVNLGAIGEGMVAGDLVNTASRVQSAAQPGTVLVAEATRRATEAAIVYEDAGEHELKGKAEAMHLWRASRVIAGTGGALRPTGLEPPFVGRERELRLLKEFLHATTEEGNARLLSIAGVAGVGKSRLLWEFFKYIDGLTETVWYHRGRCLAYGEGVAYWALAEMVRMRADIVENEEPTSARQKLRGTVESFITEEDERRWVEPRLAHLLGLEERAVSDPRDLFAAWRFFFERLASTSTTLLVFEDLQWADSGLLDFIEYLLEWSRTSPILVVTLGRPELMERRAGWGTGKRGLTSLYLEPLTPQAMDALLRGMVPGLGEDMLSAIRERAAGIPLYAVETVRMLLDRGVLVEREGVYVAQGTLDVSAVPESLQALIAARLDSLTSSQRSLLQDAAVLGKSFTPAALAMVSACSPAEVEAALAALVSKDLLSIQSDPRSPERGQYMFVQDVVRSVAYGTLPKRERKQKHLGAAEYLSQSWPETDDVTEVVASHLVDAVDAEPFAEDAPELRRRARDALVQAGDHAAALAANAVALGYYQKALALAEDESRRAALHGKVARIAQRQALYHAAREHFGKAIALLRELDDPVELAQMLADFANTEYRDGRLSEAVRVAEEAHRLITSIDRHDERVERVTAEAGVRLAKMLYFQGDELDRAVGLAEQALTIAETAGLPAVFAAGLDAKACVLAARGRRGEARLLLRGAVDVATAESATDELDKLLSNLATTEEEDDDLEAALEHYAQMEQLGSRIGARTMEHWGLVNRVQTLLELGRWEECRPIVRQLQDSDLHAQVGPDKTLTVSSLVYYNVRTSGFEDATQLLALMDEGAMAGEALEMRIALANARAAVLNAQQSADGALELAEESLRSSLRFSLPAMARQALIEAVDAAFQLGDDRTVEQLIALFRQQHRPGRQPSIDAHEQRWRARMAAHTGDSAAAERHFRDAASRFAELGRPFWLAVTRLEHGEWLTSQGRVDQAQPLIEGARRTFEELGARPWLERADRARQRSQTRSAPEAAFTAG